MNYIVLKEDLYGDNYYCFWYFLFILITISHEFVFYVLKHKKKLAKVLCLVVVVGLLLTCWDLSTSMCQHINASMLIIYVDINMLYISCYIKYIFICRILICIWYMNYGLISILSNYFSTAWFIHFDSFFFPWTELKWFHFVKVYFDICQV